MLPPALRSPTKSQVIHLFSIITPFRLNVFPTHQCLLKSCGITLSAAAELYWEDIDKTLMLPDHWAKVENEYNWEDIGKPLIGHSDLDDLKDKDQLNDLDFYQAKINYLIQLCPRERSTHPLPNSSVYCKQNNTSEYNCCLRPLFERFGDATSVHTRLYMPAAFQSVSRR